MRPRGVWRWWHFAVLAFILLDIATGIFFCVGSPSYYSSKLAPATTRSRPKTTPDAVHALKQAEPHTCGFCSLAAVYKAYGMDVEELRLRFRLGTDMPVSNFLPDTRGTIHPDMLRVLSQDGFQTQVIRPTSDDALDRLTKHLDEGHVALALVKRNDYHWVVIGGRNGEKLIIHDSLVPEPYEMAAPGYVHDDAYSLLLIRPK